MTLPLAMHMANSLLDVPVAAVTIVLAAAAVAISAARAQKSLEAEKLPLMGVMGAFVFAAQMINFTLPGMPGTSGHLGGGVLLGILLGPAAGIITITSILIVQCLIFQDGGLLALGCNVINIGVVPCLAGWWLYRTVLGRGACPPAWRQYAAAWAACLVGVTGGAGLVPIQAYMADRLVIPVTHFLAVMVGVHLVIGAIEGVVTFAILAYLRQVKPAYLSVQAASEPVKLSRKAVAISFLITAFLLAGVASWFASTYPDGLEWSLERNYGGASTALRQPTEGAQAADKTQARYALMPDYSRRAAPLGSVAPDSNGGRSGEGSWPTAKGWTSLAGVTGTGVTLLVIYIVSLLLRRRRRDRSRQAAENAEG